METREIYFNIVNGEIAMIIAALKKNTKWSMLQHQDDANNLTLKEFTRLKDHLKKFDNSYVSHNVFLTPFLDAILCEDTTGPVTRLALSSLQKFIQYNMIDIWSPNILETVQHIAHSLIHARFIGTDPSSDEVVLQKILQVMKTLFFSPLGPYLNDQAVCGILHSFFRIAFEMRLAELLRHYAENTLTEIFMLMLSHIYDTVNDSTHDNLHKMQNDNSDGQCITSNIELLPEENVHHYHKNNKTTALTPITVIDMQKKMQNALQDHNTEHVGTQKPYGYSSLNELLRFIVNLTTPSTTIEKSNSTNNADIKILYSLNLLTIALETRSSLLVTNPYFLNLIQDKLCRNLIELLKSDKITIIASTIRLSFFMFRSTRQYLKYQMELFFAKLVEIIDTEGVLYQKKECILDIVLQFLKLPNFCSELYLNYDCDLYGTDIFEDLTKLLSKNSFPITGIYSVHVLSLESLIAMIYDIYQHCQLTNKYNTSVSLNLNKKLSSHHNNLNVLNNKSSNSDVNNIEGDFLSSEQEQNIYGKELKLLTKSTDNSPLTSAVEDNVSSCSPVMIEKSHFDQKQQNYMSDNNSDYCMATYPKKVGSGETKVKNSASDKFDQVAFDKKDTKVLLTTNHVSLHSTLKDIKKILLIGTEKFNDKPSKGIQYLKDMSFFRRLHLLHREKAFGSDIINADNTDNSCINDESFDETQEIAKFLRENPNLDKKQLGEYLSNRKNLETLKAFANSFEFVNTRIDEALRMYLEAFRLPGEAPLISLMLEQFAHHWHVSNGEPFVNEDAAFALAYAIIMLNVDQHHQLVKKQMNPMSVEDFIKNLRKVNGGGNFDEQMLTEIYNAIKSEEIVMPAEQTGLVRDNYVWKIMLRRSHSPLYHYILLDAESRQSKPKTHELDYGNDNPKSNNAPRVSPYYSDMFKLLWGPVLASNLYVFDKIPSEPMVAQSSNDDKELENSSVAKSPQSKWKSSMANNNATLVDTIMQCLSQCAEIADRLQRTDIIDKICIALVKISGLSPKLSTSSGLYSDPTNFNATVSQLTGGTTILNSSHHVPISSATISNVDNNLFFNYNTTTSFGTDNSSVNVNSFNSLAGGWGTSLPSFERAIGLGSSYKALLALQTLFATVKCHGDSLHHDEGWRYFLYAFYELLGLGMLPAGSFMELEDYLSLSGRIPLCRVLRERFYYPDPRTRYNYRVRYHYHSGPYLHATPKYVVISTPTTLTAVPIVATEQPYVPATNFESNQQERTNETNHQNSNTTSLQTKTNLHTPQNYGVTTYILPAPAANNGTLAAYEQCFAKLVETFPLSTVGNSSYLASAFANSAGNSGGGGFLSSFYSYFASNNATSTSSLGGNTTEPWKSYHYNNYGGEKSKTLYAFCTDFDFTEYDIDALLQRLESSASTLHNNNANNNTSATSSSHGNDVPINNVESFGRLRSYKSGFPYYYFNKYTIYLFKDKILSAIREAGTQDISLSQKYNILSSSIDYTLLLFCGIKEFSETDRLHIETARKFIAEECQPNSLVFDSKFLKLEALQELLNSLMIITSSDLLYRTDATTTKSEDSNQNNEENESGINMPSSRSNYVSPNLGEQPLSEDYLVFTLELLIRVIIQNRDRIEFAWPAIRSYFYDIIVNRCREYRHALYNENAHFPPANRDGKMFDLDNGFRITAAGINRRSGKYTDTASKTTMSAKRPNALLNKRKNLTTSQSALNLDSPQPNQNPSLSTKILPYSEFFLERAVIGLLRLVTRLARKQHMISRVIGSLRIFLMIEDTPDSNHDHDMGRHTHISPANTSSTKNVKNRPLREIDDFAANVYVYNSTALNYFETRLSPHCAAGLFEFVKLNQSTLVAIDLTTQTFELSVQDWCVILACLERIGPAICATSISEEPLYMVDDFSLGGRGPTQKLETDSKSIDTMVNQEQSQNDNKGCLPDIINNPTAENEMACPALEDNVHSTQPSSEDNSKRDEWYFVEKNQLEPYSFPSSFINQHETQRIGTPEFQIRQPSDFNTVRVRLKPHHVFSFTKCCEILTFIVTHTLTTNNYFLVVHTLLVFVETYIKGKRLKFHTGNKQVGSDFPYTTNKHKNDKMGIEIDGSVSQFLCAYKRASFVTEDSLDNADSIFNKPLGIWYYYEMEHLPTNHVDANYGHNHLNKSNASTMIQNNNPIATQSPHSMGLKNQYTSAEDASGESDSECDILSSNDEPKIISRKGSNAKYVKNKERASPIKLENVSGEKYEQVYYQLLDMLIIMRENATILMPNTIAPTLSESHKSLLSRLPSYMRDVLQSPEPDKVTWIQSFIWPCVWKPLFKGLCRMCCDKRKQVKITSLSYLQRALLSADLQEYLGKREWEECFIQILFPLMDFYVRNIHALKSEKMAKNRGGNQWKIMASNMEECKHKACTILCKIFLQKLNILYSEEKPIEILANDHGITGGTETCEKNVKDEAFTFIWMGILGYLEQFYKASLLSVNSNVPSNNAQQTSKSGGDVLTDKNVMQNETTGSSTPVSADMLIEAIPETLKNMLLVMDTSGIFASDPILKEQTWAKIAKFLPKILLEIRLQQEHLTTNSHTPIPPGGDPLNASQLKQGDINTTATNASTVYNTGALDMMNQSNYPNNMQYMYYQQPLSSDNINQPIMYPYLDNTTYLPPNPNILPSTPSYNLNSTDLSSNINLNQYNQAINFPPFSEIPTNNLLSQPTCTSTIPPHNFYENSPKNIV